MLKMSSLFTRVVLILKVLKLDKEAHAVFETIVCKLMSSPGSLTRTIHI